MGRIFNFSAGPSTLPVEVLEQVQAELLDWGGTGMSVMEMSHRSPAYEAILAEADRDLRALLEIPDDYALLFLQGGAHQQFSQVPMAFIGEGYADYIITGEWGRKALETAQMIGRVNVPWDGANTGYNRLPVDFVADQSAAYTHFTTNETIQGVQFPTDPPIAGNWIADMSSDICSRPVDVAKYAMIYAGAQKNLGPAGLTIAIARRDYLDRIPTPFPPYLDYRVHDKHKSLYHTPPTFAIYVAGLVAKRVLGKGGLTVVQAENRAKAQMIYDELDGVFYRGHAVPSARSVMNATFFLPSAELNKMFVSEAKAVGIDGVKGHRLVGGIRASLYNALPLEAVEALVQFMRDFAAKHG